MAKRDYYDVLGVNKNSTPEQIKTGYRKQAVKYHPDKNKGDKASEEKFKEASEAYHVLSNQERKQSYDNFGHAAFENGGGGQGGGWLLVALVAPSMTTRGRRASAALLLLFSTTLLLAGCGLGGPGGNATLGFAVDLDDPEKPILVPATGMLTVYPVPDKSVEGAVKALLLHATLQPVLAEL